MNRRQVWWISVFLFRADIIQVFLQTLVINHQPVVQAFQSFALIDRIYNPHLTHEAHLNENENILGSHQVRPLRCKRCTRSCLLTLHVKTTLNKAGPFINWQSHEVMSNQKMELGSCSVYIQAIHQLVLMLWFAISQPLNTIQLRLCIVLWNSERSKLFLTIIIPLIFQSSKFEPNHMKYVIMSQQQL